MGYSRKKKQTGGFEDMKIVQNCITSLGNSITKNQDPWKFHITFSWSPMEILHAISLITLEIPYPQPAC